MDDIFISVCLKSKSMAEAASILGMSFSSFKRKALKLKVYNPNQRGLGISKLKPSISVNDILNGNYPHFQSYKLKMKLFKEGIKENKCDICGISEWMGREISCELDHIDGNKNNHRLENLRILCPNCHSQTDTFRSKNKNKKKI